MRNIWHSISVREQRLTLGVLGAILAALALLLTRAALDRLDTLDATAASLEQQLFHLDQLAKQAEDVETAFTDIAAEHSSEWTQEEIYDRLRREITRLATKDVPPRGEAARPNAAKLVDIRTLPSGNLEQGTGYRQYHIRFKTEPAPIRNLVLFLARLQESPQALRIDRVEMVRPAEATVVTATIDVTRTVIDDEPGEEEPAPAAPEPVLLANPSFEEFDAAGKSFPGWEAGGLDLAASALNVTDGETALMGVAKAAGASVYQRQELAAGVTYDLWVDMAATGPCTLAAWDEAADAALSAPAEDPGDSGVRRYHVRFTAPEHESGRVTLRVPCIVVKEEGAKVFVDNVRFNRAEY